MVTRRRRKRRRRIIRGPEFDIMGVATLKMITSSYGILCHCGWMTPLLNKRTTIVIPFVGLTFSVEDTIPHFTISIEQDYYI